MAEALVKFFNVHEVNISIPVKQPDFRLAHIREMPRFRTSGQSLGFSFRIKNNAIFQPPLMSGEVKIIVFPGRICHQAEASRSSARITYIQHFPVIDRIPVAEHAAVPDITVHMLNVHIHPAQPLSVFRPVS